MSSAWPTTAWIVLVAPLLPLCNTLLNLVTWQRPRGAPARPSDRFVSILIPARNESPRIGAALESILRQGERSFEVIVYDDQSLDDTAARLEEFAARDPRIRWIRGGELPDGWIGKPHACHHLARAARGEILFFLDADVRLEPDALAGLLDFFEKERADVLSLVPRQEMISFFERLVLPLLVLTYVSWFPLRLVPWGRNSPFVAANGQMLLARRSTYDLTGGFEALRAELVDDVAFCRRAKQLGHRVLFADGTELARCRMYESASQVWAGFSKNLFEGLGSPLVLGVASTLYFVCFVLPYLTLSSALFRGDTALLQASIEAILLLVVQRTLLALRFDQPREGILLHPFSILALLTIALNSLRWHWLDRIEWSDRVYSRRRRRLISSSSAHVAEGARSSPEGARAS